MQKHLAKVTKPGEFTASGDSSCAIRYFQPLRRRARFRLGSAWCFRLAAMTESMTSPQSRHFQPDKDPPLVAPAASSSLVATIKPWHRKQLIGGPPRARYGRKCQRTMRLWRRSCGDRRIERVRRDQETRGTGQSSGSNVRHHYTWETVLGQADLLLPYRFLEPFGLSYQYVRRTLYLLLATGKRCRIVRSVRCGW